MTHPFAPTSRQLIRPRNRRISRAATSEIECERGTCNFVKSEDVHVRHKRIRLYAFTNIIECLAPLLREPFPFYPFFFFLSFAFFLPSFCRVFVFYEDLMTSLEIWLYSSPGEVGLEIPGKSLAFVIPEESLYLSVFFLD